MKITSVKPEWGKNYNIGYIGFQFTDDSMLSEGIAYFSRWERMSDIKVSHCFVITGEHEVTEALTDKGVSTSPLGERFQDPHCHVFFREPVNYTIGLGARIARDAKAEVGSPYDFELIAGHLIVDSWVVHRLLSKSTQERVKAQVLKYADDPSGFICSELAAYSLDQQPELHDVGCLKHPDYWIEPQELFEDNEVFKRWKDQLA